MRAPLSWIKEFVELPPSVGGRDLAAALIALGLEVETVDVVADVKGPVVIGQVASIEVLTEFKKPIRSCSVDVGAQNGGLRGIVCGASNFSVGDHVVVALPGAVLPGGFEISARQTYGRTSDGMICSARELGLGDDHAGIMVLDSSVALVGSPAADLFSFGEEVLDIAVTPDRGYALSIRGVAREAAIAYGIPFNDQSTKLADLPAPASDGTPRGCSFTDPDACGVFTLRTILDIDPTVKTPLWMTQRLIAAGMRPVSLIVDITNYVMLHTGQPLHAFDADRVMGDLIARQANAGEEIETLDHVVRTLDQDDLVIADSTGPIALAGTMGGVNSEIDSHSRNILLEAANFEAVAVARMSRRHKLSSEASRRFERGVDPAVAPYASGLAASMIIELAGGRYVGMTAEEAASSRQEISLDADLPGTIAGMDLPRQTVVDSLRAIGGTVEADGAKLRVLPPSWRPDLTDPADLVEEVVRLVGYDKIPAKLPKAPAGRGLTQAQRLRRRASRAAAAAGLTEVLNYPFIGPADLDRCEVPAEDPRRMLVSLVNPLSEEQPGIRTTMLPGLLAATRRNVSRGTDSVSIFEAGAVAFPRTGGAAVAPKPSVAVRPSQEELARLSEALPTQRRHLAAVLVGPFERKGWWGGGRDAQWSDAVGIAVGIINDLGVQVEVDAASYAPFHPGRCAVVTLLDPDSSVGAVLGYAGELHPRVCASWDLPPRTCAFEFDLDLVIDAAQTRTVKGPKFHSMPVAKEDIALVVPVATPASDVARILASGAGPLLESVRLFDVYQGQQVGAGNKSLTFSLRFRAPDRTLSAEELAVARDAAIGAVAAEFGASLRT